MISAPFPTYICPTGVSTNRLPMRRNRGVPISRLHPLEKFGEGALGDAQAARRLRQALALRNLHNILIILDVHLSPPKTLSPSPPPFSDSPPGVLPLPGEEAAAAPVEKPLVQQGDHPPGPRRCGSPARRPGAPCSSPGTGRRSRSPCAPPRQNTPSKSPAPRFTWEAPCPRSPPR